MRGSERDLKDDSAGILFFPFLPCILLLGELTERRLPCRVRFSVRIRVRVRVRVRVGVRVGVGVRVRFVLGKRRHLRLGLGVVDLLHRLSQLPLRAAAVGASPDEAVQTTGIVTSLHCLAPEQQGE